MARALVLVATALAASILTAGVYANAIVWADISIGRADCGTVWEPNAVEEPCASALRRRAWATTGMLGAAALVALVTVVVGSRPPGGRGTPALALAVGIGGAVVMVGLVWGAAIERTVGT